MGWPKGVPMGPKSAETRAKMSAARLGWKPSDETRARMSAAKKGKPGHAMSVETRAKLSAAHTGKKLSDEHREKLRQAKLGKRRIKRRAKRGPMPDWWKAKISAGTKGAVRSQETREKIAAAFRGKPRPAWVIEKMKANITPEGRARMRAAVFGKPCRHSKNPVFYGSLKMRSTYETRAAAAFDKLGIEWQYEPKRFNLGRFTYTPDFYLPETETYWELKGWYGPNSRRAVEAFRREYPTLPLVVADLSCLLALERAARAA